MGDTVNDMEFGGGSWKPGHGSNLAGEFFTAMKMWMDHQYANATGKRATKASRDVIGKVGKCLCFCACAIFGTIVDNKMKRLLLTRNGGKLYNTRMIGHFEWLVHCCPKGFTPSVDKPSLTFLRRTKL